jgi:anti-sigma regulatory factor (Ser/Thr protein kinase)
MSDPEVAARVKLNLLPRTPAASHIETDRTGVISMGPLSRLDPAVIAYRVFSPALISVGAARALVGEAVAGSGADTVDSARLLTSELVTNAVVHAGTDVEVRVRRLANGVRVEVADHEAKPPVPTSVPALSLRGRGLDLVATVADDWGFECRDDGKVVWFELWAGRDAGDRWRRDGGAPFECPI